MRGGKREGAGRPSKYGEKTVVVRLPQSVASGVLESLCGRAKSNPIIARQTEPSAPIPSITSLFPIEPSEVLSFAPGETFEVDGKWYKLEAR